MSWKDKVNAWLTGLPIISPALSWASRNFSSDPSSSNSRLLQSYIVFQMVPMVWVVLHEANWKIETNTMTVMVTLITSGAASYWKSKQEDSKP